MNPKFQRVLFPLALLVWAGVLIYFYASGRIVKYLAPDFRPLARSDQPPWQPPI